MTFTAGAPLAPRPPSPLQQAQAIVGAQYKPVDYATAQANKRSVAEQNALKAATLAFVQQLQAGVAPAGQAYDQAVQQQQGLAQGAAALLANANPNQQIQSSLQAINAPAEQKAQLASQTQRLFPGAGAVLNVEQGTAPGASLLAQKAAQQQYSAGLPTVAALSGQQSLRGLLASAADTRDKLMEQRLGIGGQLPGLVQSLTQQGVQNAQADRTFALQKTQANRSYALQQAQFQNQKAQEDANRVYQYATLTQNAKLADAARAQQSNLAAQSRGLEQQRINIEKQSANRKAVASPKIIGSGSSGYYEIGPDGKPVQIVPPYGKTGKGSGITPYERYNAFEKVRTKVRQALSLEQAPGAGSIYGGASQTQFTIPKGQRQRAYNRLYASYGGSLIRAGVSKASVKAMLNTALNEAGYALPGKKVDAQGHPVGP